MAGVGVRSGGASHVHWSGRKVELAAARHPQQSPQRSEVFLEGVFFSLNPRPHIYLGAPEHEHRELTFRRARPGGSSDHCSLRWKAAATMTGLPSGAAGARNQWRCQPYEPLMEKVSLSLDSDSPLQAAQGRSAFRNLPPSSAVRSSLTGLVVYSLGRPLTWIQECRCVGSPTRPDPRSPRACLARQSTARRDNAATYRPRVPLRPQV